MIWLERGLVGLVVVVLITIAWELVKLGIENWMDS